MPNSSRPASEDRHALQPWLAVDFVAAALHWFDAHGRRDLPWQREPTPYRVWISEIMLQQTQVAVVIPFFEQFITSFPDLPSLALADQDAVLRHWAGLGYYARARHLHRTARILYHEHDGVFPTTVDELQRLPGIGRSTAGAIASLAAGQRQAILDGNVKRLLTRCFAIPGWPGQSAVLARLWSQAEALMAATSGFTSGTGRPVAAAYNQALMDLGATLCTRARPACGNCPLARHCLAHATGEVKRYPQPKPKRTLQKRQTTWLLVRDPEGRLLIEQRPPAGLWGGLWTLPEIPRDASPDAWCLEHLGCAARQVEKRPSRRHSFSHFELEIFPHNLELSRMPNRVADQDHWLWITPDQASAMAIPAPVRVILLELIAENGSVRVNN